MQYEESSPEKPLDAKNHSTSSSPGVLEDKRQAINNHGKPGVDTDKVVSPEVDTDGNLSGTMTGSSKVTIPARLPANSRAAAAQRLNDVAERPRIGEWYKAPRVLEHPAGWRLKRHFKRKSLRVSSLHYAEVERKSTKWVLIPIGMVMLICLFVFTSIAVTLIGIANATQQLYGSQVTTLEDIIPQDNLKMYDSSGHLIYQMLDQGRQTSLPLNKISPNLQHAEIAIEDQSFWQNQGYDITGIARAALDDLTRGHVVGGGSTITQQLIKNSIVGSQVTAIRKLQEIILAPSITRKYSKQQILNMYLNTVFYGQQSYGAEAATGAYFGLTDKPNEPAAAQLDVAQAATLAAIPSSPSAYDPLLHPKAAAARTQEVLHRMYVQKYISHDELVHATMEIQEPHFFKRGHLPPTVAANFDNYALNELANDLHVKVVDLSRSGLAVSTTLNRDWQNKILTIVQKNVATLALAHNMTNGAAVVIDPHTGAIRTMVGNTDPNSPVDGSFDVAADGFRQPGSSFKPFIYATAFQEGISPGTPVLDGPLTVQMCCGLPSFTPTNYDMSYHGLITYRTALANSYNIPAVKLLMKVGVDNSLKTAEKMGLGPYQGIPNYTMVLGSLSVHLVNMTSAYGVFATGGVRVPPHAIETAKDALGRTIFQAPTVGQRVLSKQVSYLMTNVLSDNVARSTEFGKCSQLDLFSNTQSQCYAGNPGPIRPSAAKTGTSNDFRDNWTIGYTSDYVVGVWVGNNNNTPMINIIGVDGAGPAWHDTMNLIEKGRPIRAFTIPPGVVEKTVHYPGITSTDWYVSK
ncbi:MAG TPA: transglycosylase domain-containing protein [Ktedonobacteraceae bacterium]|jgi:penicillin-binding protein 1A|nr:transglycosylase domain-containing protein [Ktedonobacteraceae bacterium]